MLVGTSISMPLAQRICGVVVIVVVFETEKKVVPLVFYLVGVERR